MRAPSDPALRLRGALAALALLATACAGPRRMEDGAVRPYAPELEAGARGPWIERFSARGMALWFVAAEHTSQRDSATFRLVERALDESGARVVVVEGVPTSAGVDRTALLESFERSVRGDTYPHGEASYAALEARARGISFVGGEPDERQLQRAAHAAGFDDRDLSGFYFVRQLPQWRRTGRLDGAEPATLWTELLGHYRGVLDLRLPDDSWPAFLAWYEAANGTPFDAAAIDTETSAPIEGPLRTQRLSCVLGLERDRHLVRTVEHLLRDYATVLVVYGRSHLACQRPAFEAYLGPGERVAEERTER